jgi:uncharacterized membrane protein YdbT with pleckstrin-like domain
MRCPQCGFDALAQSAFCSRCGARLGQPKPAEVREYALALIRPSYWHYAHLLVVGGLMVIFGAAIIYGNPSNGLAGLALILAGFFIWGLVALGRRTVTWRITSDRLIEKRGLLATTRREVELSDIRSIEVSRGLIQRLIRLGDIVIASAASADYLIRMVDVYDPDAVAETVRKARLRRLA